MDCITLLFDLHHPLLQPKIPHKVCSLQTENVRLGFNDNLIWGKSVKISCILTGI